MASDLEEQLRLSNAALQELQETFETLAEEGLIHATVLEVGKETSTVVQSGNNAIVEVTTPKKIKIVAGDSVLTVPKTNQIYKKLDQPLSVGEIYPVNKLIDAKHIEVSINGVDTQIKISANLGKIEEGDRVILDPAQKCAIIKIESLKVAHIPDIVEVVTWDDIGGQNTAKKELIEAVEMPAKHPKLFKFYNKKQTKGVLLYGDPGCGKTMMGKAVANSLTTKGQKAGFIYVKGPEVLDPYVGVAEANVRNLFKRARFHKQKYGSTAVIFIDEAEAIMGVRGAHNAHMEKTIVPTFLAEMDGVEQSDAIVILATNHPDMLDPAITRDGRIDRKVRISRPSQTEAELIFSIYLKKVPLAKGLTIEIAAKETASALFSPNHALYNVEFDSGLTAINLSHLVSGAMIAGIVDKATSLAIYRDLENKAKGTGLTLADLMTAVHQTYTQNRDTHHDSVIENIANGRRVVSIKKVTT